MGEVQYIDHATLTPTIPFLGYSFYMFKRLAFQHEREVRIGTYRGDVHLKYFDDQSEGLRRVSSAPPLGQGFDAGVNTPAAAPR